MTTPTPLPSRSLKVLAQAAKWSLGLLVIAWLVFIAGWGVLHAFIVPRIDEWRPLLETRASRLLGVSVRIGSINAHSTGFIPSVELVDVRLLDGQGRDALNLPRILASVSPRSLLGLGFEQLYIEQPRLNIRRSAAGKIYVAGLDVSGGQGNDDTVADWFFSQREFVIHQGTIEWVDEQRGVPILALNAVDLVVRNRLATHQIRLDATPPPQWGERFGLMASFRQPLLSLKKGQWRQWNGEAFADFSRVDVSQLRQYADLGIDVVRGSGAVRAWAEINRAQVERATADFALANVSTTLQGGLRPLELSSASGRIAGSIQPDSFDLATVGLQFDTPDGLHWPGGNMHVNYRRSSDTSPASVEFEADKFDLAALTQIADRVPLSNTLREAIDRHTPSGVLGEIQASWRQAPGAAATFKVRGKVAGLAIAAQPALPAPSTAYALGTPGVKGLNASFELTDAGGRASLAMRDGSLDFPGVFDQPEVPVVQLSADVQWTVRGDRFAVESSNIKFSNADADGEAQIKWHTADAGPHDARFPGVLDLQASLSRADASRVHRYLPLELGNEVREYVRDGVTSGNASGVKFKVKGDLHHLPFKDAKQGEFQVSANLRDVNFAYIPRALQAADALPWPGLTSLTGELQIDRKTLQIKVASGRVDSATGLQITKAQAQIPDLFQSAKVAVNVEFAGPLSDVLEFVKASPVSQMTGQVLSGATATGNAAYRLKLNVPLDDAGKTTVQGNVALSGNDIVMSDASPRLVAAKGQVNFSEKGFSIVGGQARLFGGEARIEGGTSSNGTTVLRVQGMATGEGLRQARELGDAGGLTQFASGGAAYNAVLTFRASATPDVTVSSNLQGMALNLPLPLNKAAESVMPVRFEMTGQRLSLDVGQVGSINYQRDMSAPEPRILRGAIALGLTPEESAPMPQSGVMANINLTSVDIDAWANLFSRAVNGNATKAAANGSTPLVQAYLPDTFAIRARELRVSGRRLNNLVIGGSRVGRTWRANVDANELNGYMEYRQAEGASLGSVYARLARLTLAPSSAQEVETLLDQQEASIPALDIVVDDLELRGNRLGRVEIDAVNRNTARVREGGVREWRLNKFNVTVPEATFAASGNWVTVNAQAAAPAATESVGITNDKRRTVMNFKLDIADAGALLTRFGTKDVVRRGKGKMEGQVAWLGSPLKPDYPSMNGAFAVNVENGQFLKADAGAAKLLSVLSLQALPRRLALDFRDVFSEGFAFDFLRGDVMIEQGTAKTNNLQMKGVTAAVLMEGRADIARETQDVNVVVVPEINAGTASLIATAINPAIGVGTFLAQLFLRKPLMEAATQEFHVDGSWADPQVTKVDRQAAKRSGTNGANSTKGATGQPESTTNR